MWLLHVKVAPEKPGVSRSEMSPERVGAPVTSMWSPACIQLGLTPESRSMVVPSSRTSMLRNIVTNCRGESAVGRQVKDVLAASVRGGAVFPAVTRAGGVDELRV